MSTSKSFCDYYTVLGIAPTATVHDIKKAFRKLAILHHPDKKDPKDISDASDFCILRKAYEILNEPALRREYDRQYNLHNPQPSRVSRVSRANPYPRYPTPTMESMRTDSGARQRQREEPRSPFEMQRENSHWGGKWAQDKDSRERFRRSESPSPVSPSFSPATKRTGAASKSMRTTFTYSVNISREHMTPCYGELFDFEPDALRRAQVNIQTPMQKAHNLAVAMSYHPAVETKDCPIKIWEWKIQTGTEPCIFCMGFSKDVSRCPGCQAAACKMCLTLIVMRS